MQLHDASDIKQRARRLIKSLEMVYLDNTRIFYFRSFGSKSRATARIWNLPRILQIALKIQPSYAIEVISHHFDKLREEDKDKVLIHELLHIPKNFSGSLLSHKGRARNLHSEVNKLYKKLVTKI